MKVTVNITVEDVTMELTPAECQELIRKLNSLSPRSDQAGQSLMSEQARKARDQLENRFHPMSGSPLSSTYG